MNESGNAGFEILHAEDQGQESHVEEKEEEEAAPNVEPNESHLCFTTVFRNSLQYRQRIKKGLDLFSLKLVTDEFIDWFTFLKTCCSFSAIITKIFVSILKLILNLTIIITVSKFTFRNINIFLR